MRPAVIEATRRAVEELAADTRSGPAILVTAPWRDGDAIYNAVILLDGGSIRARSIQARAAELRRVRRETSLRRGSAAGSHRLPRGAARRPHLRGHLVPAVVAHLAKQGAEMLIVPNGSPFEREKVGQRIALSTDRVRETGLPLVYINQVGGQDELVFDGGSFVINADRQLVVRFPVWAEKTHATRWVRSPGGWACEPQDLAPLPDEPGNTYQGLMVGLRDYVNKNRFPGVLLGLSGGIDSALTAVIAVDALGPERVLGVRLPSRFTSDESQTDADVSAGRLGMRLETIPIAGVVDAVEQAVGPLFAGRPRDITEENMQARARGLLLMAVSNKFGSMLLTTGNKSEMSVGYATLYGDMCGGYSVLKDLYKTEVYALAEWRNRCVPKGALGPAGEVVPAERPDEGANRRAAAESEGSGYVAGVRGARRDADRARRTGAQRGRHRARRSRARDRQPDPEHVVHRRIQAPAGTSGRQDVEPQLRPRSPISDHQSVPRALMSLSSAFWNSTWRPILPRS